MASVLDRSYGMCEFFDAYPWNENEIRAKLMNFQVDYRCHASTRQSEAQHHVTVYFSGIRVGISSVIFDYRPCEMDILLVIPLAHAWAPPSSYPITGLMKSWYLAGASAGIYPSTTF